MSVENPLRALGTVLGISATIVGVEWAIVRGAHHWLLHLLLPSGILMGAVALLLGTGYLAEAVGLAREQHLLTSWKCLRIPGLRESYEAVGLTRRRHIVGAYGYGASPAAIGKLREAIAEGYCTPSSALLLRWSRDINNEEDEVLYAARHGRSSRMGVRPEDDDF